MIEINVKVTSEHINKAKHCGFHLDHYFNKEEKGEIATNVTTNCAVAVALQEIFPLCDVSSTISNISRFYENIDDERWFINYRTDEVKLFLEAFDRFTPIQRIDLLPEFNFTIVVKDSVLDIILRQAGMNIEKFEEILTKTGHLTLV